MNAIKLQLFLLLNIFYVSNFVRRIQGSHRVTSKKSYMVYLVQSPKSPKPFDDRLCSGVLINPLFIITARDCVYDIDFIYAIAGYDTYVTDAQIEVDACTREKKKKVVYYCIPKQYEKKFEKWSLIDIALVKVESSYDFKDETFKTFCSYIPSSIPINFDSKYQNPGTDGLVLGWGHTQDWQQPFDEKNHNEQYLRYASIRIMDKEACKQDYTQYPNLDINIIENDRIICASEKGELDENGKIVLLGDPPAKLDGCAGGLKLMRYDDELCEEEQQLRREVLRSNLTNDSNINKNDSIIKTKNKTVLNQTNESRRSGICQNYYGGPLVTWVGDKEVLAGVASGSVVKDDSKCMGPFLYTSTVCVGDFLHCVLSESDFPDMTRRREICGYETIERHISWKNHPAGAADNEDLVSEKKIVDDKLNTKTRLSKIKGVIKLGSEMIAVRPQRPLDQ